MNFASLDNLWCCQCHRCLSHNLWLLSIANHRFRRKKVGEKNGKATWQTAKKRRTERISLYRSNKGDCYPFFKLYMQKSVTKNTNYTHTQKDVVLKVTVYQTDSKLNRWCHSTFLFLGLLNLELIECWCRESSSALSHFVIWKLRLI